jgi:glucosamine--fructose-6-phosphate aminotransferase (isomerizing)
VSLYSEIFEQPASLLRLFHLQRKTIEKIAQTIKSRDIRYVFVAARGTSENAGRFANYLLGARNGFPVALAAPSLFTFYNPPQLEGALVVGISQSGRSPDIVSVLKEGRRQGCLTLAITNETNSALAETAEFTVDIEAGEETSVAATKTYTGELMAIAMLSAALTDDETFWEQIRSVPDWVQSALAYDPVMSISVQRYRAMSSCIVLGRGYDYATAHEWALKLKELTYVEAESYSSADFQHGPIALVNARFPILAVIHKGAIYASMLEVLKRLQEERSAELLVISDGEEAKALAHTALPLPSGVPEWLSPLISIIPAQLFCYHLAVAKGCDTETSRGMLKVTETI